MSNKSQSNIAAVLAYWTKTVTANSEDDVSDVLKMMQEVDNRTDAGSMFEKMFGYDPITMYDRKEMSNLLDEIAEDVPSTMEDSFGPPQKLHILNKAMENLADMRSDFNSAVLVNTVAEETGYLDPTMKRIADLSCLKESMTEQFDSSDIDFGDDMTEDDPDELTLPGMGDDDGEIYDDDGGDD